MIPKIIHYCWFGKNPLPEMALKCIESWKKYLPDYEIKEWNEENFDINIVPYTKEAYEAKKYAFVSDYARFWILHNQGGLYFDTDVEVIKPLDEVIAKGPFMGCEKDYDPITQMGPLVAPGLGLAAEQGLPLYRDILDLYGRIHFIKEDGSQNLDNVVFHTTQYLEKKGLEKKDGIQCIEGIWIYPREFFCPMDHISQKIEITENTLSIHHYMASWLPASERFKHTVQRIVGPKATNAIVWFKSQLRKVGLIK